MNVFFRMLATIALGICLCSCAATQILAEWNSPDFKGPPFRKVMVIGLFKDPTVRRVFEDVFAKALAANGTATLVGYTYIPEPVIDRDRLEKLLKELGADAVLVSALKGSEMESQQFTSQPPLLYGAYNYNYDFNSINVQYRLDNVKTNLYRVQDATLVWSGITESVDRVTMEKEVADFSKVVVKTLKDKKFIY